MSLTNQSELGKAKSGPGALASPSKQSNAAGDCLRPFIHKFRTPQRSYLLDVNTNRVLCVDPVTWEIVDDVGALSREEVAQKHSGTLASAELFSAYEGVVRAQEADGLLLPRRGPLAPPQDIELVRERLATGRKRLKLWVTEDCNFRCDYCMYSGEYRGRTGHTNRHMSWDVAQRAIDEYIEHSQDSRKGTNKGLRTIAFWGGEPLLNFSVIRRSIEYARGKLKDKVCFHLTTNGSLLKGDVAGFLASQNVSIQVSLDGPSHIHDHRRHFVGGKGTWAEVVHNLREFLEKYPQYDGVTPGVFPLCLSATLSPLLNALEVDEFFSSNICRLIPLRRFDMVACKMAPSGSEYMESLAPQDRMIPGVATLYRRFLDNMGKGFIDRDPADNRWVFQRGLFEKPFWEFLTRRIAGRGRWLDGRARSAAMCIPGSSVCLVDVDGGYYPCQRTPKSEAFKIGDVRTGIDVSRAHSLKREYDEFCRDACEQCWCVNFCRVPCPAYVRDGPVLSAEAKQKACSQYREDTHRMLVELYGILEINPHALGYIKGAGASGDDKSEAQHQRAATGRRT